MIEFISGIVVGLVVWPVTKWVYTRLTKWSADV